MANPSYTIRVLEEKDIDSDCDEKIRCFLGAIFPQWKEIFLHRRIWYKKPPLFTVLCEQGTAVVGHVAVVVRAMTTTWNYRYDVAGVQGVSVSPEHRGRGLSRNMLRLALDEARKRDFPYAVLYCKEPLVRFYTAQGWKLPEENLIMWNHDNLPVSIRSNCPMYYELNEQPFPEGPIDIHSFPLHEGPP